MDPSPPDEHPPEFGAGGRPGYCALLLSEIPVPRCRAPAGCHRNMAGLPAHPFAPAGVYRCARSGYDVQHVARPSRSCAPALARPPVLSVLWQECRASRARPGAPLTALCSASFCLCGATALPARVSGLKARGVLCWPDSSGPVGGEFHGTNSDQHKARSRCCCGVRLTAETADEDSALRRHPDTYSVIPHFPPGDPSTHPTRTRLPLFSRKLCIFTPTATAMGEKGGQSDPAHHTL